MRPLAALPWLAAALAEESAQSSRRATYRAALANILRRSPRLEHAWWLPGPDLSFSLSPDGGRLLVVNPMQDASWLLNTRTGDSIMLVNRKGGSAAFSPDGGRFVIGGYQRSWLCSLETLQPMAPPLSQKGWAAQVGFSRDGRWLATLSRKTGIRVWDAVTGELISELAHPEVAAFAFSPDGRRLASSGQDEYVRMWAMPSGRLLTEERLGSPWRCVFGPDGRGLLVGRRGAHDALLLDAASLQPIAPPLRHGDYVESVTLSADGRHAATGSKDGTARIWALPGGAPSSPPLLLDSECVALAFSPDGEMLATGGLDGRVRVWAVRSGAPGSAWLRHAASVRELVFSPDGARLCSSGADGMVRIWQWRPPPPAGLSLEGVDDGIWNAHFFAQAKRLVVRGARGARIFDTAMGQPVTPPLEHVSGVHWADVSPDGKQLLTEGRDKTVRVWGVPDGRMVGSRELPAEVVDARWLAAAGRFVALAANGDLFLGSATRNAPLRLLKNGTSRGHELNVAPDRRTFAATFANREIGLWTDEGERVVFLLDGAAVVRKVRFSPDGLYLGAADQTGVIEFRRCRDGRQIGRPVHHAGGVLDLAFAPEGERLASLGADGLVRISRVPGGEAATAVIRPEPASMQLAWSPDGRWLLVAGTQGGQIWDARTGTPITPRVQYARSVAGAAFTPDSNALLVLTDDGRLWRERLDLPAWPDDDWRFLAQTLSGHEVDVTGSAVPWIPRDTSAGTNAAMAMPRWREIRPRLHDLISPAR